MKVAFWISKHKILSSQEKLLKDNGYKIVHYNTGIYNVEDFLNEIKNFNSEIYERVLLITIVPESRVIVKFNDGTCKVYEFGGGFKRLTEYVKRYDDKWSL